MQVLEKRCVDVCLVTMDGLGETGAEVRLGWGEVSNVCSVQCEVWAMQSVLCSMHTAGSTAPSCIV